MPLSSVSSGLAFLPCALRYSRTTRLHHNFRRQLHKTSSRWLESVQPEASSTLQDVGLIRKVGSKLSFNVRDTNNIRKVKSPGQKKALNNTVTTTELPIEATHVPTEEVDYIRSHHGGFGEDNVTKLVNLREELSLKSKELQEAGDGQDSTFSLVVERVAAQIELRNLPLLSRCATLYYNDTSQTALRMLEQMLQKRKHLLGHEQLKDHPLSTRDIEHLSFLRLIRPRANASTRLLLRTEAQVYRHLMNIYRANGGKIMTMKERREEQRQERVRSLSIGKARRSRATLPTSKFLAAAKVVRQVASQSQSTTNFQPVAEPTRPPLEQPPITAQIIDTSFIAQIPVRTEEALEVPTLSNDLSRVLFNPGVYQLRDPRSRVYNFDPHLQNIIPVEEFNWDALNPYITSSEDQFLRDVAIEQKKRYIGSSSSMSAAMSQFHFLLSAWRPLDFTNLSKKMDSGLTSFTQITRAPASIFLRHRNGVYAVDADKEHDSPNILMMHGKSMEKMLTLEKDEFDKYKKPKNGEEAPQVDVKPEQYHYSTVENFLLRSQLDAHDPRLPGTGMFDLKTRAVAGIRMYLGNHGSGMNYEIKERFGNWESYDREYYDMIRAAFLKYSLQVRMGRMDGIFVAYHNIARIFGFQYISIDELDQALHGQSDPTVGNREFKMSIKLMNEIFDRATKAYPGESLRLMFDTREPPKNASEKNSSIFMRIFAEVMTEDEIEATQSAGKEVIEDYEDSMARGIDPREEARAAKLLKLKEGVTTRATPSTLDSIAADTSFLDSVLGQKIESVLNPDPKPEVKDALETDVKAPVEAEPKRKVLSWRLKIYNEVNGHIVDRPEQITSDDRWNVHYTIEEESENVQGLYNAVKNRRRNMFTFDEDEDAHQNWFLRNIIKLNESGKQWRLQQNELDADKEKVVLYPSS